MISFGETSFAGNPIFVPKANAETEDDGYILSQVYRSDEHRSDIVILDAATMKQLALLRLDHHMTYQFHGEWYSDLL
jgi:all-trans-8'-apo-beta-carotenal 15,15'-oxygenase